MKIQTKYLIFLTTWLLINATFIFIMQDIMISYFSVSFGLFLIFNGMFVISHAKEIDKYTEKKSRWKMELGFESATKFNKKLNRVNAYLAIIIGIVLIFWKFLFN